MDLFRKTWTPAEAGVCLASVRMKKKAESDKEVRNNCSLRVLQCCCDFLCVYVGEVRLDQVPGLQLG